MRKNPKPFKLSILGILLLIIIPLLLIISIIKYQLAVSIWNGEERINLVWGDNPIFVTTFNPAGDKLTAIIIPADLYLKAPQNYGSCKAESLWKLSFLEKKDGRLAAMAMQNFLGAPVDGWIFSKSKSNIKNVFTPEIIKKTLQKNNYQSNLSYLDKARLFLSVRNLSSSKIQIINLDNKNLIQKSKLPDKTAIITIDEKQLDGYLAEVFIDDNIQKENLNIAVKNATGINGLGSKFARIMQNLGGRTISIENGKKDDNASCLVKDKKANSSTLYKIKTLTKCVMREGNPQEADIVVSLGKKIAEELN